jgi:hypothetical protein
VVLYGAGILLASSAIALFGWGAHAGWGLLAGGVWNLVNLWCLSRLLAAWLGPQRSTARVVRWLVIKFPLLYGVAWLLLSRAWVSMVGFGVGFTLVLLAALFCSSSMHNA